MGFMLLVYCGNKKEKAIGQGDKLENGVRINI
jgi:hypothetical protein